MRLFRTGLPALDRRLNGGLPPGLVCLYGEPDAGSTSMALTIAREASLAGATVGFIKMKPGLDMEYIRSHCGDDCVVGMPRFGEEAMEQVYNLLRNGVDVVIMDPLDGAVPAADLSDRVGTRNYNDQARLLSFGLARLKSVAIPAGALLITVSESRTKLPTHKIVPTYRGVLAKYSQHVFRISTVRRTTAYGSISNRARTIELISSTTAIPGTLLQYETHPDLVSRGAELLKCCLDTGVATRQGRSYTIGSERIGLSFDDAAVYVENNYERLYAEIVGEL